MRNSRRVVEASTAFLGVDTKIDAYSDQQGPPLIPYMFEKCNPPANRHSTYTTFLWKALEKLQIDYKGIPIHGNTAILVPNGVLATEFRASLAEKDVHDQYNFVDAQTGARSITASNIHHGATNSKHAAQIIVDALDAFDGMERLIIFAVDLDATQSSSRYASSARIYRALTRAHLFVVVIQEHVKSG